MRGKDREVIFIFFKIRVYDINFEKKNCNKASAPLITIAVIFFFFNGSDGFAPGSPWIE